MAFTQVDSWSGTVATVVAPVVAPAIAGKIEAVSVWVTGMSDYGTPPISNVVKGSQFTAAVRWRNNSNVRVRGRVSVVLFSPSGKEYAVGIAHFQDFIAEPSVYGVPDTSPIALNEVGTYGLAVLLSLEPA